MGVNLWGESPLYVNPVNVSVFSTLTKVLAEGKGVSVRKGLKEARTLATQTGMTNQWLKDQGLLSVKELWVNIHYPTTVR